MILILTKRMEIMFMQGCTVSRNNIGPVWLKCNLTVNICHECHKLGFSSFNATQPLKALSFKVVHIMMSNFFFSVFYTCFYWTEHENEVDEKCRYSLEAWKNQQSLDKEIESHKVKLPMKTYHPEKNLVDQYVKMKTLTIYFTI